MPFSFHLPLRADGRAFFFLNNSLEAWGLALAVTVLAGAAMLFLRHYVLRHVAANARKAETNIDDFLATMLSRTYFVFIAAFAMYFGSTFLDLNTKRDLFVARVAVGALLLQLAIWGRRRPARGATACAWAATANGAPRAAS
jgi:uncharacterized membrane-anchored protein